MIKTQKMSQVGLSRESRQSAKSDIRTEVQVQDDIRHAIKVLGSYCFIDIDDYSADDLKYIKSRIKTSFQSFDKVNLQLIQIYVEKRYQLESRWCV